MRIRHREQAQVEQKVRNSKQTEYAAVKPSSDVITYFFIQELLQGNKGMV